MREDENRSKELYLSIPNIPANYRKRIRLYVDGKMSAAFRERLGLQ